MSRIGRVSSLGHLTSRPLSESRAHGLGPNSSSCLCWSLAGPLKGTELFIGPSVASLMIDSSVRVMLLIRHSRFPSFSRVQGVPTRPLSLSFSRACSKVNVISWLSSSFCLAARSWVDPFPARNLSLLNCDRNHGQSSCANRKSASLNYTDVIIKVRVSENSSSFCTFSYEPSKSGHRPLALVVVLAQQTAVPSGRFSACRPPLWSGS